MPEIRFLGVDKSDYVKSIIHVDLKKDKAKNGNRR